MKSQCSRRPHPLFDPGGYLWYPPGEDSADLFDPKCRSEAKGTLIAMTDDGPLAAALPSVDAPRGHPDEIQRSRAPRQLASQMGSDDA